MRNAFEPTAGAWSMLGTPAAAAALAGTGADWVLLDAQHGLYDDRAVVESLARLSAMRVADIRVRVARNDPALIGRALDAGATGVIVPMISDAAEAKTAVDACRYAPQGTRSWGPMSAYWGGATVPAEEANTRVMCGVMVETPSALDQIEAIAATPGVDLVFVGPFDLSISLGTTHAALLADTSADAPLRRIVEACRKHGVRAGAFGGDLEATRALYGLGFTDVAVAVDAAMLTAAGTAAIAQARSL